MQAEPRRNLPSLLAALLSYQRTHPFPSMQYQKANANATLSNGITLRLYNAICFLASSVVVDQVLLSTGGLGGEVGLGWEGVVVRSLFAITGIWYVSERVVCSGRVVGQSTYRQHEHRRHRLIQRASRSPDQHDRSCTRQRAGRLSSMHFCQHHGIPYLALRKQQQKH